MIAHLLVAGSATTYWIEKVRLSKKPVTSGLAAVFIGCSHLVVSWRRLQVPPWQLSVSYFCSGQSTEFGFGTRRNSL